MFLDQDRLYPLAHLYWERAAQQGRPGRTCASDYLACFSLGICLSGMLLFGKLHIFYCGRMYVIVVAVRAHAMADCCSGVCFSGNAFARLKVGDYFYYGKGMPVSYEVCPCLHGLFRSRTTSRELE